MWVYYNPNPAHQRVSDCPIRAICKATGKDWESVFLGVMVFSCKLSDMPNANHVWGAYLRDNGYVRHLVDDHDQYVYTVKDFCNDNPEGTFILCIDGHVVCVTDGNYYDTWDSGGEIPIYYFAKE